MTKNLFAKAAPVRHGYIQFESNGRKHSHQIKEILTIGRSSDNNVSLKDEFVSSRHCRIEHREQHFIIRDLRSRNGTWLNTVAILEAPLKNGDQIMVGKTRLTFSETLIVERNDFYLQSKNPQWQKELAQIPNFAKSDLTVLLSGPSGSGKEILAQQIHQQSLRAINPFICVNCSALNDTLIESELFGHVRGSFTSAENDRQGAFLAAHGGTLFLDEIGDLPLNSQPKLLRALENSEIRPVGSDRTIKVNVRVIAATHKNLANLVKQGLFREDLYFRLNVIRILIPTLNSRPEDFVSLLHHFGRSYNVKFSLPAVEQLKMYSWPGNIRELKNLVARAKAYFPQTPITPHHLEQLLEAPLPLPLSLPNDKGLLKEIEFKLIQERLVANLGNQRRTANELGMPKSTLHDRIKDYGINVKELLKSRGVSTKQGAH